LLTVVYNTRANKQVRFHATSSICMPPPDGQRLAGGWLHGRYVDGYPSVGEVHNLDLWPMTTGNHIARRRVLLWRWWLGLKTFTVALRYWTLRP